MSSLALILKAKRRIVVNLFAHLKRHVAIHLAVFCVVIGGMMAGGFFFFRLIFGYLMGLEVIGPPLMDQVMAMTLTTFFSMLVFSNLIVTLSTAYISREVNFYMALPVERPAIFLFRLVESIVYSSWAFVVLSLPLFAAFGVARRVSPAFYAVTALLAIPFLLIPAGIGSILTMVFSALFPARKTFRMAALLGALGVALALLMVRMTGLRSALHSADLENFRQIMGVLELGSAPLLPSSWLMRAMLAAQNGAWSEFWGWTGALVSTALFVAQVCLWLAPAIYYRGWRLAQESSSPRRQGAGREAPSRLDRLFRFLSPPMRAIVVKDIKTFWRDPAQWSQLMILFGLLFVYIANLRSVPRYSLDVAFNSAFWTTLLSFFNLTAGCFVLCILTTRFVYPMLSLEGKQFWTLGLAPLRREALVWEKYWLCWASTLFLAALLTLFSNFVLKVSAAMAALSLATVAMMSFGLTSISIGLGAMTPNFKEDNPARIANGMGGTMNVFLSLLYVGLVVSIEIWPAFLIASGRLGAMRSPHLLIGAAAAALVAVNAAAIFIPMRLGLRRWREMEF